MEKEDSISKLASYGRDSERGNDVLYSKLVPSGKSPQPKPSGPPETPFIAVERVNESVS